MPLNVEKLHSLPNLRSLPDETEYRPLYSLSLSHISRRAEDLHVHYKPSPFNIRWIYGYNNKVGVINLNERGKSMAFYAASNCGVLYDWSKHQMKILQGHKNLITVIAASGDGKILVTADSGPENIIIIWDSYDCFPQRTLFNPHGDVKLAKVAISSDAKYLLTLGYREKAVINWWIWSFGHALPDAYHDVNIGRGGVVDMGFNPYNSSQFVLLAKHDLWLGMSTKIFIVERGILKETNNYELKIRMLEKKPSPEYGRFSCFTFVENTSQIIVATTRGYVLVYSNTIECAENVSTDYKQLTFVKMLHIDSKGVNVIRSVDGVVVTGNTVGEVKFYDTRMELVYTMSGLPVDSISGLSFNLLPSKYQVLDPKCKKKCICWDKVIPRVCPETVGEVCEKLLEKKLLLDASVANKPFLFRDFIICTKNQGIAFVEFLTEKLTTVVDSKISSAQAIAAHPQKSMVCVGFANGVLELYNCAQRKLFLRLDLREHYKMVVPANQDSIHDDSYVDRPHICVTCLRYSPSGLHLVCALDSGKIIFLRTSILNILDEKKHTNVAVTQIEFSADSLTMATADKSREVCVYKYDCTNYVWNFVGRQRAHYKDITSLFFLPLRNENGEYRLLSLGTDRMLIEYDVSVVSDECLSISGSYAVEQTAVPLVGIPWPTLKNLEPENCHTDLPIFLLANDEFKYKLVNASSAKTLSTILGPRYENPVCRAKLVTRKTDDREEQYMVFATKNVIGLQKMPLDGNPWKHVGLLAHPVQVLDMSFNEKSGLLFTIGVKDSAVIQWEANYKSADLSTQSGGDELDPYYCLIENGRPGWLFQEIRDLFYYVQILCQGTFSPDVRRVKDYIPIESLPDLMRTLGFFPTEYEVENLIAEARYKVYRKEPSQEIDFEEFVKLYLNHRPAFGESYKKIRNAFRNFATVEEDAISSESSAIIRRQDLIDALTSNGECFSLELCWYLLSILCGHSVEERANMVEGDFSFLPEKISLKEFLTYIMGVKEMEWSDQSLKGSLYSTGTSSTGTMSSE